MSEVPPRYFPPPRPELIGRLAAGDRALAAAMVQNEERLPQGALPIRANEDHATVYRLVAGMAARMREIEDGRRQLLCLFLPGDLFAIKAMLLQRQPDSIICLSGCIVTSLRASEATALAVENGDVALRLMWQLGEDERRLHNNVAMLGRGTAIERIAAVLVDLMGRRTVLGMQPEQARRLTMRQQDLADYVGLTTVHVSRTLRTLREARAVEVTGSTITVIDELTLIRHAAPLLDIYESEAVEFGGRL